jgi:hypothetical protein
MQNNITVAHDIHPVQQIPFQVNKFDVGQLDTLSMLRSRTENYTGTEHIPLFHSIPVSIYIY